MAKTLNMYQNNFSEFNAVESMRRNTNTFANVGEFKQQISSSDSSGSSPPYQENKSQSPNYGSRPESSSSSIGYRTRSSSITVPSQTPLTAVSTPPLSEKDSKSPPARIQQTLNPNAKEYKFSNSASFNFNTTTPAFYPQANHSQKTIGQTPPLTTKTVSNLYKTELCRSQIETGVCRYGAKCQFAHGEHEIRSVTRHPKYKTDLCRSFHTTGTCPYGNRCHFIHNTGPSFETTPPAENTRNTFDFLDKTNVWSDRKSMAEKLRPKKEERSNSIATSNIWSNKITDKSWGNNLIQDRKEHPVSWDIGWPLSEQNKVQGTVNSVQNSHKIGSWGNQKSVFNNNSLFSNTSSSGIWETSSKNENTFSSLFAESMSFNEKRPLEKKHDNYDPFSSLTQKSSSQPAFDIFSSIYDDAEKFDIESTNQSSKNRLPVFEQLTSDTF